MKNYLPVILLALFPQFAQAQTVCDTALIYADTVNNQVCFDTIGPVRYCFANGIPDHDDNHNQPFFSVEASEVEYAMCAYPDTAAAFTPLYEEVETVGCTDTYTFGICINGVTFDPNSAVTFEDSTGQNNLDWHLEASSGTNSIGANMGTENGGHINPKGEYHYHGAATDYFTDSLNVDGSAHSPIVGWAADGFPVYYKYVYSDVDDTSSAIVGLSSGYSLKSGTRPGDSVLTGPGGAYDGNYVEDYEYATATLDECNGRYGKTPEYPYGTYYYVLTDNFPYIPRCFKGAVLDVTFQVGPAAACGSTTADTDCSPAVYGCMDPFSTNYNASANVDDGTCTYSSCSIAIAIDSNATCNNNNGGLSAMPSGVTPPLTFLWSHGAPVPTAINLAAGSYTITVTDGTGCTATDSETVSTMCEQVSGLRELVQQDTSVYLVWDTVCGASKYKIVWKVAGAGSWNVAYKQTNVGAFFLGGLSADTSYRWAVKADCGYNGWASTSTAATFTTLSGPCAVPTTLAVSPVGQNKAKLTWNQPANVIKYRLRWRATGAGSWNTVVKDAVWGFQWLTGLSSGTTYEWQIRSVCQYGNASGTLWSPLQQFTTATSKNDQAFIDPAAASELIIIYPNPNNGSFTLGMQGLDEAVDIRVTDMTGNLVFAERGSTQAQLAIDLGEHAQGVYMLQLTGPNIALVQRVVVR